MKAIITGVNGFVGGHLSNLLCSEGVQVWGTTRGFSHNYYLNNKTTLIKTDMNDVDELVGLLNQIKPDYLFHLAGESNVKKSWGNKAQTFDANVIKTLRLLEAVRKSKVAENIRILTVGSSEEYGRVNAKAVPIQENTPLKPVSPYGISKATISMIARQYNTAYQLKIIHARPFNHIGPGQKTGFVVPDFAAQIAAIEKGMQKNVLRVGNLDAQRDFSDVRDIVRAYKMLLEHGEFGEIYNVCSGVGVTIQHILESLIRLSTVSIEVIKDENLLRPTDIPVYIGDSGKIKSEVNWNHEIPLNDTLFDTLQDIRRHHNNASLI
ncbi:GDP-mannose 4,6-dehydratase [uncultured Paenibacillus sp.]|uniref:GDP-mannose 4,6-dehydratase n=1 Tax=uncultured Paenibacillus sp. TaxID=227322 RepID=UPI0028D6AF78|nr:GDP-mannose 4,6-dehydratase [uncultured Paenibacillus sp.]